ncbi:MAG TPA: hypothetical protein VNJ03_12570 [Vicinamibacterales bacterium]|nr:hypothetical protein [Vicinamibacterales bacterium]
MPAIAFYISGHGFGHVSRQIEIINALAPRLPPDVRILIRTGAARWLFDRTLTTPTVFIDGPCDSGIVQIDSLRLDEAATITAAADFYSTFAERAAADAGLLREHEAVLVVSDAPPLACAAAAAAAIPSIVISNFTWDWIYGGYATQFAAGAPDVIPTIRSAYALAAAGWRLPMHGGFETIDVVLNLPFVARHARPDRTRDQVLRHFSIPPGRPVALASFGGYGLTGLDPLRSTASTAGPSCSPTSTRRPRRQEVSRS